MIVPDASIIAAAAGSDDATGQRCRDLLQSARHAAIPDVADVEAAAVLRKHWIAGRIDNARPRTALEALARLPLPRYPARHLLNRADDLRANLTPYDAVYVALAEALRAELVTADRRLAAATGIRCRVRLVSPSGV